MDKRKLALQIGFYFVLISAIALPFQNLYLNIGFSLKISQFFVFLVSFFALLFGVKRFDEYKNFLIIFFLFFIVTLLSSIFSEGIERSYFLSFSFIFLMFFVISTWFVAELGKGSVVKIISALCWANAVFSIYGIAQLFLFFAGFSANVNFEEWDVVPRVPFFSSENVHASFVLTSISFFLFRFFDAGNKKKVFDFIGVALCFGGLIATGTRSAMIIFCIAFFMVFAFSNKNKFSYILFFCLMLIAAFFVVRYWDLLFLRFQKISVDSGTVGVRFEVYKMAIQAFFDNPILGYGLGMTPVLFGRQDIHSLFLMVLSEAGVISFVLYVAAVSYVFKLLIRARKLTQFVLEDGVSSISYTNAFIVSMLMVFGFSLSEPALYNQNIYLLLGLALAWRTLFTNINYNSGCLSRNGK